MISPVSLLSIYTDMSTAVVVGGGVSGLASAYYLSKVANNKFSKIIVLEASDRLGGWMRTTKNSDGSLFEHGPRSFRPAEEAGKNTLRLVEELDCADSVIGIGSKSPAARNRYIYMNNTMYRLPQGGLMDTLLRQHPPFTQKFLPVLWKEMRVPKSDLEDEDINSFFNRRFGKEFADYLFNPMCRGIFAGDTRKLSMKSCFEKIFNTEKRAGSVVTGMFFKPEEKVYKDMAPININKDITSYRLLHQAQQEKWNIWSFRNGIQELVESLERELRSNECVELRTQSPCTRLNFMNEKVQITIGDEVIEADELISSIYSKYLGNLLPREHHELANCLDQIPAATCAVVNFQFPGKQDIPQGFGHLLPSFEDGPTLGVIYDSCTFKDHQGENPDTTRLTVMLGGIWYDELVDRLRGHEDEDRFINFARDVVRSHLNITDQPIRVQASIQRDCIPQYVVGHKALLHRIFDYIHDRDLPLTLVGSSYQGVSLNDCIYQARLAMQHLTATED